MGVRLRISSLLLAAFSTVFSISCAKFELSKDASNSANSIGRSVTLKWTASKEKAVNSVGGGYKVTYGLGQIDANSTTIDIPFRAGSTLQPQTAIKFPSGGTFKVRVTAYSAINPQGSSTEVVTNVQ